MKYQYAKVIFQEIPDEITLCIEFIVKTVIRDYIVLKK